MAALLFGLFQAAMAAAGALGGQGLVLVGGWWPHVVGSALLGWIGGRMIVGSGDEPVVPAGQMPHRPQSATTTTVRQRVASNKSAPEEMTDAKRATLQDADRHNRAGSRKRARRGYRR